MSTGSDSQGVVPPLHPTPPAHQNHSQSPKQPTRPDGPLTPDLGPLVCAKMKIPATKIHIPEPLQPLARWAWHVGRWYWILYICFLIKPHYVFLRYMFPVLTQGMRYQPPVLPDEMAPIPLNGPRLVVYYQTHQNQDGSRISILPLVQKPGIKVTHVNLAAIHLNRNDNNNDRLLTLNDHVPEDERNDSLWPELRILQAAGIKVLGMLGGAAKGTYSVHTLDSEVPAVFEKYYSALRDFVRYRGLDGLDLDVEEHMSLRGIVHLIDRLREDFGKDFIITLAPVCPALFDPRRNLSGFDYRELEAMRAKDIAFYNTQFYCGWGDCSNTILYEMILMTGWEPEKIVVGLLTSPGNGTGFIPFSRLATVIPLMIGQHRRFGGVMGWEYFNGMPGGRERPWEWAQEMTKIMSIGQNLDPNVVAPVGHIMPDADEDGDAAEATRPGSFEYHTDGLAED